MSSIPPRQLRRIPPRSYARNLERDPVDGEYHVSGGNPGRVEDGSAYIYADVNPRKRCIGRELIIPWPENPTPEEAKELINSRWRLALDTIDRVQALYPHAKVLLSNSTYFHTADLSSLKIVDDRPVCSFKPDFHHSPEEMFASAKQSTHLQFANAVFLNMQGWAILQSRERDPTMKKRSDIEVAVGLVHLGVKLEAFEGVSIFGVDPMLRALSLRSDPQLSFRQNAKALLSSFQDMREEEHSQLYVRLLSEEGLREPGLDV